MAEFPATFPVDVGGPDATEADGHASASAVLSSQRPLSGAAAGAGAGSARVNLPFSASEADGHASGQGTLQQQAPWTGAAGGQAGAAGALSQVAPSATVERTYVLACGGESVEIIVRGVFVAAGDGSGVGLDFYPSGYYGPDVQLAGAAGGAAGATATGMQQAVGLSGHAEGQGTGELAPANVPLSGTAAGRATGGAVPSQDQPLAGGADGHAGATAVGPQLPVEFRGTAEGQGGATGEEGKVPLSARGDGHASGAATLRIDVPLSGIAEGAATAAILPRSTAVGPAVQLSLYGPRLSLETFPGPDVRCTLYGPRLALGLRAERRR